MAYFKRAEFWHRTGTDADKARRRAEILDKALELHRHDGDGDCPVCGRSSALNEVWHCQAEAEAQALRKEAAAAEKAHGALRDAERVAQAAATPLPPILIDGQRARR